jgi:hypothetical protein
MEIKMMMMNRMRRMRWGGHVVCMGEEGECI